MQAFVVFSFLLFTAVLIQKPTVAQSINDTTYSDSLVLSSEDVDSAITEYDKYTPILGGEEVRMQNAKPINGMVKDYYPDSIVKHKGYYTNGQLISRYKNFYKNGQLERSFAISGTSKIVIKSYYLSGTPKEYIEYRKGEMVKYIDYYPNGKVNTLEEHDKRTSYYTVYETYYSNGQIKSSLKLINKKKWLYYQTDYYQSGSVMEEGSVLYNPSYYDYQRQGSWKVYNSDGTLKETREYYQGELGIKCKSCVKGD